MIRTLVTGAALVVLGVVVAGLGIHQLGSVRAARKWPSARQPRVGRGVATFEILIGIAVTGTGGVLLTTLLDAAPLLRLGVAAGVAVLVLVVGMLVAAKVADRVELNALIRSPSPLYRTTAPGPGAPQQTATRATGPVNASPSQRDPREVDNTAGPDPAVPPGAQPGWVLTDDAGTWYLCVTTERGARLVQLPDFRLAPPEPGRRLELAGTVELSVWPLDGSAEGGASAAATGRDAAVAP